MVVAAVVAGARTVQSVEQLGYEREAQRTAIRFRRPILALAITEPPIQQGLRRLYTGWPLSLSIYPSEGKWLCGGNRTDHSRQVVAVDLAITCISRKS
jgi:hypothetical protein